MNFIASILISLMTIIGNQNEQKEEYVTIKFYNKSATSIPLIIPNVMNPNLSPFSESTVGIPVGTTIKFFNKKKKYDLITINKDTPTELVVNELIDVRKKELGL